MAVGDPAERRHRRGRLSDPGRSRSRRPKRRSRRCRPSVRSRAPASRRRCCRSSRRRCSGCAWTGRARTAARAARPPAGARHARRRAAPRRCVPRGPRTRPGGGDGPCRPRCPGRRRCRRSTYPHRASSTARPWLAGDRRGPRAARRCAAGARPPEARRGTARRRRSRGPGPGRSRRRRRPRDDGARRPGPRSDRSLTRAPSTRGSRRPGPLRSRRAAPSPGGAAA